MSESEEQRLQRLARNQFVKALPKRFYKQVSVGQEMTILLDGRPVMTPMKTRLVLPNRQLAEAVAAEWQAQAEFINPHTMPFTKLANTVQDRAGEHAEAIRADILSYAGNDVVCYRAAQPDELVALQQVHLDPVLAWAETVLAARLQITDGLRHVEQPAESLAGIRQRLASLGSHPLVALHAMTTLSGSALLAIMVADGALSAPAAWQAASLEEAWQAERWGRDSDAEARSLAREAEFVTAAKFLNLAAKS